MLSSWKKASEGFLFATPRCPRANYAPQISHAADPRWRPYDPALSAGQLRTNCVPTARHTHDLTVPRAAEDRRGRDFLSKSSTNSHHCTRCRDSLVGPESRKTTTENRRGKSAAPAADFSISPRWRETRKSRRSKAARPRAKAEDSLSARLDRSPSFKTWAAGTRFRRALGLL